MKRIEVRLALPIVAPLLDVIKTAIDGLRRRPAAAVALPDLDEEFHAAWSEELLAAQRGDVEILLGLFGEEFFREGMIAFDEENAEAVLRACAAVRLRLRTSALGPLGDEALETGIADPQALAEPVRRAFLGYVFLATLQELIIEHLGASMLGPRAE